MVSISKDIAPTGRSGSDLARTCSASHVTGRRQRRMPCDLCRWSYRATAQGRRVGSRPGRSELLVCIPMPAAKPLRVGCPAIQPKSASISSTTVGRSTKSTSAQTEQGTVLVKVRRLRAVEGRLSMPDDFSPEGLLIRGVGSGTSSRIHETSARVRRDGTFTVYLAAGYGYCLGVSDSRWASDPWIGVSDKQGNQPPGPIQLIAYPARTLTVRVTRGPKHVPVAAASVEIAGGEDSALWQMARLQSRLGLGSALGRMCTDRDGCARLRSAKASMPSGWKPAIGKRPRRRTSSRTSRQRSSFTALGLISA